MIVRRKGGLTEFIPSPQEEARRPDPRPRPGLLENLHQRLARLERASKLPADEAEAFTALLRGCGPTSRATSSCTPV